MESSFEFAHGSKPHYLGVRTSPIMADADTGRFFSRERVELNDEFSTKRRTYSFHTTLTIFDWDDTLLCSSFIQQNQLLQIPSAEISSFAAFELARVQTSACRALRLALSLGSVVIITNAEAGWVELSVSRFFRQLGDLLLNVPVISARTQFESQFPGAPLSWKAAAFAYVLHERFNDCFYVPKVVISIGDSEEEKIALRIAAGQHAAIRSCTVKYLPHPTPLALATQLDMVVDRLEALCRNGSSTCIDIIIQESNDLLHTFRHTPVFNANDSSSCKLLWVNSEAPGSNLGREYQLRVPSKRFQSRTALPSTKKLMYPSTKNCDRIVETHSSVESSSAVVLLLAASSGAPIS